MAVDCGFFNGDFREEKHQILDDPKRGGTGVTQRTRRLPEALNSATVERGRWNVFFTVLSATWGLLHGPQRAPFSVGERGGTSFSSALKPGVVPTIHQNTY